MIRQGPQKLALSRLSLFTLGIVGSSFQFSGSRGVSTCKLHSPSQGKGTACVWATGWPRLCEVTNGRVESSYCVQGCLFVFACRLSLDGRCNCQRGPTVAIVIQAAEHTIVLWYMDCSPAPRSLNVQAYGRFRRSTLHIGKQYSPQSKTVVPAGSRVGGPCTRMGNALARTDYAVLHHLKDAAGTIAGKRGARV